MTREQIQHEGDRPLPCAAQEAFQCRQDAMSDDEKTILSAMALQKGEAEAAEIFRESPEHLRDYTILKLSLIHIWQSCCFHGMCRSSRLSIRCAAAEPCQLRLR